MDVAVTINTNDCISQPTLYQSSLQPGDTSPIGPPQPQGCPLWDVISTTKEFGMAAETPVPAFKPPQNSNTTPTRLHHGLQLVVGGQ